MMFHRAPDGIPTTVARRSLLPILLLACAAVPTAHAATRPAERARHAMVAGPEPLAVAEGLAVLREGGNAIDAAVTISFALAVTQPEAGNIGGGGYMLIRTADGAANVVDYREVAPAAATADMYLDERGVPRPGESLDTYKAVAVPGSVAGLAMALERYGTIPLPRALEPAIRLARGGFVVDRRLAEALESSSRRLARYPATRAVFFDGARPLREGARLVQPDLAATLETVARAGPDAFYREDLAATLENDMRNHHGLITRQDLAGYRPVIRPAIRGTYRAHTILSVPPSSSGGVALIQILNMLEPFDLASLGHNSSAYIHHVAEAMKRAFADRARWLGDPEFVDVPVDSMISPPYAGVLMRSFHPHRATSAAAAGPGNPLVQESDSTTHYSVIDSSGNVVSNTTTLNASFGCGAVATGLGYFLNNEMDDFSSKPDTPNLYGLVGGAANSIAPRKRMLSSMTPTIVLSRSGEGTGGNASSPYLVVGTPGGATIITSVLQTILNVLDFGMELQAAVNAPHFHHQWSPDRIVLERGGFARDVLDALSTRGHEIQEGGERGDLQAILVDAESGWIHGASDARGGGQSRGY